MVSFFALAHCWGWKVVEVLPPVGESGENHARNIVGRRHNSGRVENGPPFVRNKAIQVRWSFPA